MINRYDNPQIFKYESQFVPTELPWDVIQKNMDIKQKKRDDFRTDAAKLAATPKGMEYTVDSYGNTIEVNDYKISAEKANAINTKIANLSKKMAGTELNSDHYAEYAELQKEKLALDNLNSVFENRTNAINAIHEQRIKDKVNPGDVRGIWYQKEIEKVLADKTGTYKPQVQAHQDVFDESKFVVDATSLINSELQDIGAIPAGEYLKSWKRTGRTPDKIQRVFEGAFDSNQELQQLIKMEAEDVAYRNTGSFDINQKMSVKDPKGNVVEMTIYDIVKENKKQNMLTQAMGRISSDGSQGISSNASYFKGLERQDKLNEKIPSLSVLNQEIKGINFMEAFTLVQDYKSKIKSSNKELMAAFGTIGASINPDGSIKDSKAYNAAKTQIAQIETANKNFIDLQNKVLNSKEFKTDLQKMKQEAYDMVGNAEHKPYWKEYLDKAKTPQEVEAALNHMANASGITKIKNLYNHNLDMYLTRELQTQDKPTESTLIHWGTGSKENKVIFADIQSQFKLADNIDAKDGSGNSLNVNNIVLDETAGYGIFTDVDGKLKLKLKSKANSFFSQADDVIVELDDRTTFGKKLLQDSYNQAKELFKATGDLQYEQLADEIETTIINNSETLITSFKDDAKMRTVQNKMDVLPIGNTWTYAQVSPDGSDKMFYTITALGNKRFDVTITDGQKNDITDKMLGEHEPISSPQEIYKLMQLQNGRR